MSDDKTPTNYAAIIWRHSGVVWNGKQNVAHSAGDTVTPGSLTDLDISAGLKDGKLTIQWKETPTIVKRVSGGNTTPAKTTPAAKKPAAKK